MNTLYLQSLKMVGESVGYVLKSPFVNLKILKLDAKSAGFYGVHRIQLSASFHGFCSEILNKAASSFL